MNAKLKTAEQRRKSNNDVCCHTTKRKEGDEALEYAQDGWTGYSLGRIP